MNYSTPVVRNFPYDNPVTKLACAVGLGWVAYVAISSAKRDDRLPQRRKHRQALTSNDIDKAIDSRNRAYGGRSPRIPTSPIIQDITIHDEEEDK